LKEKVLVTGASGFIGRYVVDALLKKEYEVIALVHKNQMQESRHIQTLTGDICEESFIRQVAELMKRCDILIHLAADIDMCGSDRTILVNCLGTYHMINLAKDLAVKSFVYMSSVPVIGKPRILPITENHPADPKTLYHITKDAGEKMVTQLSSEEMRVVILRIASPVGIGMNSRNYLSYLLEKCEKNEQVELYGTGKRSQNYIDVRDIAEAVLCSLSAAASGIFLIAGKDTVTNRKLAFLCRKIMGSSSEIIWGKREDLEEEDQWRLSSEKARRLLGYMPAYALEDTIRWITGSMGAHGV